MSVQIVPYATVEYATTFLVVMNASAMRGTQADIVQLVKYIFLSFFTDQD